MRESASPAEREPGAVRPAALGELGALADKAGIPGIRHEADVLAARLTEGRFYVACLGQFKRGKSTLLNALIGASILPTGVAPVTSVVTVLRHGERRAVRVRTFDSGWRDIPPGTLADYVSDEHNPGNVKHVAGIEVFEPAPLLQKGLCLVDTPGIGSVFRENTTATQEFLPQIDAALVVLGADPPITADELALVQDVSTRVRHLLFVLAKADRLSDPERLEAVVFTKRVLAETLKGATAGGAEILAISATEVLSQRGATRDWPMLTGALENLASHGGGALVTAAERRGTAFLVARLISSIEEKIGTLQRPVDESEARLEALRAGAMQAERAFGDLAPLFAAEESRLVDILEREREVFLRNVRPAAADELERSLRSLQERGPALRDLALEEAVDVARCHLEEWQSRKMAEVDALYHTSMQRFSDLLANVEVALRKAHPTLPILATTVDPALRAPSRFYMTELLGAAPTSVGRRLLDFVGISSERRRRSIHKQAQEYLRSLLDVNSARIKNDFRERVNGGRWELEVEIRGRLRQAVVTAERFVTQARELQAAGSHAVASERDRLQAVLREVRDLKQTSSDPEVGHGTSD